MSAPTYNKDDITLSDRCWRHNHLPVDAKHYLENGWWRKRTHLDDLLESADLRAAETAISAYRSGHEEPTRMEFADLARYVDRCACALISRGIRPGDFVSLQLQNGWQFPILVYGTIRAGAIPNPIPHIYRKLEVDFMVRHARSKILFVPQVNSGFSWTEMGDELLESVDTLEAVIAVPPTLDVNDQFVREFLGQAWEENQELAAELVRRRPGPDDPAVLLYTSGTTGTPKAVIHTHNTIWAAGRAIPEALSLTQDDVCFMASTMGHLTGFYWGMLLPLSLGQKVVYQDVWDPRQLLGLLATERVSWTLSATPFAIDLVAASRRLKDEGLDVDSSSLRAFVCGGAPIPSQVARDVHEALSLSLISLWGCTEVGICTIHSLGTDIETLASSDGMPVASMEVRIAGLDCAPVETGEEGDLHARGPGIFAGYFRQPELTDAMRTADGWYDTGDRGKQLPDGGIRITGRTKDIIVRGGQNVPVVEIENSLMKLPDVQAVAIIGIPDARLGERACAVIEAQGKTFTLEELQFHLDNSGTTRQFWPEYVVNVDAMPRTPAGKIKKVELRELYSDIGERT